MSLTLICQNRESAGNQNNANFTNFTSHHDRASASFYLDLARFIRHLFWSSCFQLTTQSTGTSLRDTFCNCRLSTGPFQQSRRWRVSAQVVSTSLPERRPLIFSSPSSIPGKIRKIRSNLTKFYSRIRNFLVLLKLFSVRYTCHR